VLAALHINVGGGVAMFTDASRQIVGGMLINATLCGTRPFDFLRDIAPVAGMVVRRPHIGHLSRLGRPTLCWASICEMRRMLPSMLPAIDFKLVDIRCWDLSY
jgi:hypothetical protein